MALCSVLRRMGKEAIPCSQGPFKRTEILKYEHLFTSDPVPREGARVIILDCSVPSRTGALEDLVKSLPWALVDHHETGEYADKDESPGGPVFIDPKAPSTTFLILKIIDALGMEPNQEEAELLFFGLCTDTGFFRHLDAGRYEAFETAARLVRLGANPKTAYADIHGGKSLDSRRLLGHILSRTESYFDGRLIFSHEEYQETCEFGLEGRDSDSLYQLLQSVSGVEAIVIIRQESPEFCTIGFRSRDSVDVGSIAKSFGGGGHKNAAGLRMEGSISSLKPKIIKKFEKIFN